LEFFPKILIETAQVPILLDGAEILWKMVTLWVGHDNVTDRQQTEAHAIGKHNVVTLA